MNITHIAGEILKLSPRDRAVLAETIWESLEDPYLIDSELSDQEVIILARRRDQEIEQGAVMPLPNKELMAKLRDEH